jgi:hypothetical protein
VPGQRGLPAIRPRKFSAPLSVMKTTMVLLSRPLFDAYARASIVERLSGVGLAFSGRAAVLTTPIYECRLQPRFAAARERPHVATPCETDPLQVYANETNKAMIDLSAQSAALNYNDDTAFMHALADAHTAAMHQARLGGALEGSALRRELVLHTTSQVIEARAELRADRSRRCGQSRRDASPDDRGSRHGS